MSNARIAAPSRCATHMLAVLVLAFAVACSDDSGPDVSTWFDGPAPADALAACSEVHAAEQKRSVPLEVFLHESVPADSARQLIVGMRSYANLYGLQLAAAQPRANKVPYAILFSASYDAVKAALAEAGLDAPELGPRATRRAEEITGRVVGEELRAILAKYSAPERAGVALVILDQIAAPQSAVAASLGEVAGLAFSPFDPGEDGSGSKLAATLGLPRHRPTVFVGAQQLAHIENPGAVVMHELGHALGLRHVDRPDNLMSLSRKQDCRVGLDDEQLKTIYATIDRALAK